MEQKRIVFQAAWAFGGVAALLICGGWSCKPREGDCVDKDGDGYGENCEAGADCDDDNEAVHPGATESCNGIDDNCDELTDEGVTTEYFADTDGDGFGAGAAVLACSAPEGHVEDGTDCDDSDENVGGSVAYYPDADHDGYGDSGGTPEQVCGTPPADHAANADDCDDEDGARSPAATETCDGVDNNCDGTNDEGVTTSYYADADGDGFGDAEAEPLAACSAPAGHVADNTDCDDDNSEIRPEATEVPDDGIDQDCSGADLELSDTNAVYVSLTGDDLNAGTQAAPVRNLRAAVLAAAAGGQDFIVLSGGRFDTDYNNAMHGRVAIEEALTIMGGFDPVSWERNLAEQHTTIFGNSAPAVLVEARDPETNNPAPVVFDGLRVEGGELAISSGLRIVAGDVVVSNCSVVSGNADFDSVAIQSAEGAEGSLRLVNTVVTVGTGNPTQGIVAYVPVVMLNSEVTGGNSEAGAVGIELHRDAVIVNSVVRAGTGNGGTVALSIPDWGTTEVPPEIVVVNSLLDAGESVTAQTNTIYNQLLGNSLVLVNSILLAGSPNAGNTARNLRVAPPLAENDPETQVTLVHNLFWGPPNYALYLPVSTQTNVMSVNDINACGWQNCEAAEGNLLADPMLGVGDTVQAGSPCIDHGVDPTPWYDGGRAGTDRRGTTRPQGAGWDIGPLELIPPG